MFFSGGLFLSRFSREQGVGLCFQGGFIFWHVLISDFTLIGILVVEN